MVGHPGLEQTRLAIVLASFGEADDVAVWVHPCTPTVHQGAHAHVAPLGATHGSHAVSAAVGGEVRLAVSITTEGATCEEQPSTEQSFFSMVPPEMADAPPQESRQGVLAPGPLGA